MSRGESHRCVRSPSPAPPCFMHWPQTHFRMTSGSAYSTLLLLDMSTIKGPERHMDVFRLQKPVLLLDLYVRVWKISDFREFFSKYMRYGIPRNFMKFPTEYGRDWSTKNARDSVSTEFRGHPTPSLLFLCSNYISYQGLEGRGDSKDSKNSLLFFSSFSTNCLLSQKYYL
jgi:hypothetical protein